MKAEDFRLGNYYHFKQTGNKYSELNGWVVSEMQINVLESLQHETKLEWCKPIPLTEEWLLKLGFEKMPYYTLANNLIKSLGNRYRYLAFADVGTPNEMLWIHDIDDDVVCLHNYDYNGYMTVHKLQNLFHALTGEELTLNPTQ